MDNPGNTPIGLGRRVALTYGVATSVLVAGAAVSGPFGRLVFGLLALLVAGQLYVGHRPRLAARHLVGIGLAVLAVSGFVGSLEGLRTLAWAVPTVALGLLYMGARVALLDVAAADEGPAAVPPTALGAHLAAASDLVVVGAWEAESRFYAPRDRARARDDLARAIGRDREADWLAHPERVHPLPPALTAVETERVSVTTVGPAERLRFASGYRPIDPEVCDDYLAIEANQTAEAHLWRARGARGARRPTLVCMHGYGHGGLGIDSFVFRALGCPLDWLVGLGLDVVLFVLPLHGPRRMARRSGRGFLDGDLLRTRAALGQSIWDLRRLVRLAPRRGCRPDRASGVQSRRLRCGTLRHPRERARLRRTDLPGRRPGAAAVRRRCGWPATVARGRRCRRRPGAHGVATVRTDGAAGEAAGRGRSHRRGTPRSDHPTGAARSTLGALGEGADPVAREARTAPFDRGSLRRGVAEHLGRTMLG